MRMNHDNLPVGLSSYPQSNHEILMFVCLGRRKTSEIPPKVGTGIGFRVLVFRVEGCRGARVRVYCRKLVLSQ